MKIKSLLKFTAALAPAAVLAAMGVLAATMPAKENSDVNANTARVLDNSQVPPIDAKAPQNLSTAVFGMG